MMMTQHNMGPIRRLFVFAIQRAKLDLPLGHTLLARLIPVPVVVEEYYGTLLRYRVSVVVEAERNGL